MSCYISSIVFPVKHPRCLNLPCCSHSSRNRVSTSTGWSLAWMFRSRSDPFDDVPQHCRPDRMFAVSRAPFPWETSGGAQDQHPPATDARADPLVTESAPWCFGPATPPKAAAPARPAALPAPRAAVAAAPLVQAPPRQADSLPQPASASSGPQQPTDPSQQPTDQSRRRKMLRPRCASGPAAPAAHAWAVETCVDMHMHTCHTAACRTYLRLRVACSWRGSQVRIPTPYICTEYTRRHLW